MICPCCSGNNYNECCQPYHVGTQYPLTAEALMRSRYAAYAIPNGAYLMHTTYPTKRYLHDTQDMQEWGETNKWTALEIVAKPAKHQVEFKAYYTDTKGILQLHHELSTFKKIDNRWYYFSSKFIQV